MKPLFKLIMSCFIFVFTIPTLANDFVIATGSEGGKYEAIGHQVQVAIEKATK